MERRRFIKNTAAFTTLLTTPLSYSQGLFTGIGRPIQQTLMLPIFLHPYGTEKSAVLKLC